MAKGKGAKHLALFRVSDSAHPKASLSQGEENVQPKKRIYGLTVCRKLELESFESPVTFGRFVVRQWVV